MLLLLSTAYASGGVSPVAYETITPLQNGASFAFSLAGAGDLDGNGYDDLVVGSPGADGGNSDGGQADIYIGGSGGLVLATTLQGVSYSEALGKTVAGVGDLDGNGYDDVAIGSQYAYNGTDSVGAVYLFYGDAGGPSASPDVTLWGGFRYDGMGWRVFPGDDINGDGFDDLLVGEWGNDSGGDIEGHMDVYYGDASGVGSTANDSLTTRELEDWYGASAAAGDTNGDGFADVLVGTTEALEYASVIERVYLYLGDASAIDTTSTWVLESHQSYDGIGTALALPGDLDGDGYGDGVIAGPEYDDGRTIDAGALWIHRGSAAGLEEAIDETIYGDQTGAYLGELLQSLGDVDHDGLADFAVSSPYYRATQYNEGATWVYMGGTRGVVEADGMPLLGGTGQTYLGRSLGAGDFDGDGYGDLAVGLLGTERVQLYAGFAPDEDGDLSGADVDCDDANPDVFPGAIERCDGVDQDCDGVPDDEAADAPVWYADHDTDGFGDAAVEIRACVVPDGYVAGAGDCDDANAAAWPGAAEVADDGVDQDCDGADAHAEVDSEPPLGADDSAGAPVKNDTDSDDPKAEEGGCGCASGGPSPWFGSLLLVGILRRRRDPIPYA